MPGLAAMKAEECLHDGRCEGLVRFVGGHELAVEERTKELG
jgi:hypothetical protein